MKRMIAVLLGVTLLVSAALAEEIVGRKGNALWAYRAGDDGLILTGYFGSEGNVVIPEELDGQPVSAIGEECFRGGTLTSVTVPAGVAHIGAHAFAECLSLTAAFLHSASLEVDGGAFEGCSRLTAVLLEDDDALLAGDAFAGCGALQLIAGGAGSEAGELAGALGVRFATLAKETPQDQNAAAETEARQPEEEQKQKAWAAQEQPISICSWVSRFDGGDVRARVTAQGSAGLRPAPNKNDPYFARVPAESVVTVLSIEENGWLHIRTQEGMEGYISGKLAEIEWETLMPYYASFVRIRGKGNANVHRFADIGSLDLARVPVGKVYPVMGVARNGWYKILLDDGYTQGYVSDSMTLYIGTDWRADAAQEE